MTVSNWGRIIIGIVVFLLVVLVLDQVLARQGRSVPGIGGVAVLGLGCLTILGLYRTYVDRPK